VRWVLSWEELLSIVNMKRKEMHKKGKNTHTKMK